MTNTTKPEKIVKADTFALSIKDLIDEFIYTIDLDADYQREKVWSTEEQQLLLDSILNDIDIPKLYLARAEDNKQFDYECIDGKQRMITLRTFFRPEHEKDSKPLTLPLFNQEYSYKKLRRDHPNIAEKIEKYKLDFVCYDMSSLEEGARDKLIRDIFRRLQLGVRLNTGERLKAIQGTMRDFVFDEMGDDAPFFRNTSLVAKRFSRQTTLAQICLNSFDRQKTGEFSRARLQDLEDFFNDNSNLPMDDANLGRIRSVLGAMDSAFSGSASNISSKAVAVSAYLFSERLFLKGKAASIANFAGFYVKLLDEIKRNMEFVKRYKSVENVEVMEKFQKYTLQASVEPSSIRRRDAFLEEAFSHFMNPATKGKLIGVK
jgi:Protein of unknown function DUF262